MEAGARFDLLGLFGDGYARLGDFCVELLDGCKVLIDDWLDLDLFAGMLRSLLCDGVREPFFERCRFFGCGRFRVLWAWLLDRPADRLQCFPPTLRRNRYQTKFASHPVRNLAARPQPSIGRRLTKAIAQPVEQVGLQDRRRRAVAAAQVAESFWPICIVTNEQLFDPSLAKRAEISGHIHDLEKRIARQRANLGIAASRRGAGSALRIVT
jgi:hypothetical protein